MSTNTYVALKTYTIPSTQATYTFDLTGITGYTDLFIEVAGRTTYSAEVNYWMQFNNDGGTGSLYSTTRLQGNGSTAVSNRTANAGVGYIGYVPGANDASGVYSASSIHIMNYSNSTTYKTSICRSSLPEYAAAFVSLWRNTNAIQYITLGCDAGSWATGSTFTIYGIANADVGAYATGGIITQDANYYYHAFGNSGYFVPNRNLTCDYLILAGGGGSGAWSGSGGGGAGGFLTSIGGSTLSLTSGTSYAATVGAGGAGSTVDGVGQHGSNGSNSVFNSLTAIGGGGGGNGSDVSLAYLTAGQNGGSGGGGGGRGALSGGTGTSGQGYAGGASQADASSNAAGGGGGGAGGAGTQAPSNAHGGNGGIGIYNSLTDSFGTLTGIGQLSGGHYYFAGGGSGCGNTGNPGTPGLGGGGTGNGGNGTPNTGGGAGGTQGGTTGGAGGSGLIIVRYSK